MCECVGVCGRGGGSGCRVENHHHHPHYIIFIIMTCILARVLARGTPTHYTKPSTRCYHTMSAHMDNLNEQDPPNLLICSICNNVQMVPPPSNPSNTVRFCLAEGPPLKCERCCSCQACTYACTLKFIATLTYDEMMALAVEKYVSTSGDEFDFYCSKDFEE